MSKTEEVGATEIVTLDTNGEVIENENVIKFNKPYNFEGTIYEKVDLSGLDELTASDMIKVNKIMEKSGSISFLPEMTMEYACHIASIATKLPLEFFTHLHPKEAVKVKNRVTSFFYGTD